VGCDSGVIKIYSTSDEVLSPSRAPLFVCSGHTKSICALDFSSRGGTLLSSAKDGTARIWDCIETGESLSELICDCTPAATTAAAPSSQRQQQILVRGCAFPDIDGRVALTVASARRGKAYLTQWAQPRQGEPFALVVRTECSPCPASAMSMSQDGQLLALGSVDGSIILWSIENWAVLKTFAQVHDLPVTCIAARPHEVFLQGEDFTGVRIHARSASADSQLACLSLQRRVPRKRRNHSPSASGSSFAILQLIHRMMCATLVMWILSPLAREATDKCQHVWNRGDLKALCRCILDDVLIAPPNRPGVMSPPY
jgi:WD40 repeat protein